MAHAKAAKSPFLTGYVERTIDSLNLRTVVRALRAKRGHELLDAALIPGGTVDTAALAAAKADELPRLFPKELQEAAAEGVALLEGTGSMTTFERLCDNAVAHYVQKGPQSTLWGGDRGGLPLCTAKRADRAADHSLRPAGGAGEGDHPRKVA